MFQGYLQENDLILENVMEMIRKEIEKCDYLLGYFLVFKFQEL